ncbi:unnamed protein product [Rhodiola kirilowii]
MSRRKSVVQVGISPSSLRRSPRFVAKNETRSRENFENPNFESSSVLRRSPRIGELGDTNSVEDPKTPNLESVRKQVRPSRAGSLLSPSVCGRNESVVDFSQKEGMGKSCGSKLRRSPRFRGSCVEQPDGLKLGALEKKPKAGVRTAKHTEKLGKERVALRRSSRFLDQQINYKDADTKLDSVVEEICERDGDCSEQMVKRNRRKSVSPVGPEEELSEATKNESKEANAGKRKRKRGKEGSGAVRGWTNEQEMALERAYLTMKPTPRFWKKVSKMFFNGLLGVSTPQAESLKNGSSSISARKKSVSRFSKATPLISPPVLKQVKNKALHEKYIDQLHFREAKRQAELIRAKKITVGKENLKPTRNQKPNAIKAAKHALESDARDVIFQFHQLRDKVMDSPSSPTMTCSLATAAKMKMNYSQSSFVTFPDRARSLISLLTLDEKIQQLCNNVTRNPRLGLPPYEWWSESLHGIATNGPGISFDGSIKGATSFPQVILSAAAFNRSLWFEIAAAIAVEARAMYNLGQAGLTYWAPNVNIFRDPRWGRGQETPGEDPMLTSAFAVEYVTGFQGKEDEGGHLTAYDLESWGNFSRYSFNAVVSKQDMEDTYQPPFKSCVQQACASGDLIQKVRTDWGFKGYITSDCDAVATVYEYQHYVASPQDAVADVLKAGVDINCGTYMLHNTKSAIEQGKVQEEDLNQALFNLFSVLLRLGLYNGDPAKGQYGKLAVIGPMGNDSAKLGGGYSGIPCNPQSLLDGFEAYVNKTFYATGCSSVACPSDDKFDEAIHIAEEVEYVIVVAGLDLSQETEDHDRVSLLLPGKQMALISAVSEASQKPLILVLTGGGPIDVSFAQHDPRIASILWIGYPGEAGPKALAQIIFGDHNPDPSRGFPGRTYRFYTGDRVYGFGGGLSYTTYHYHLMSAPDVISLSKFIKSSPNEKSPEHNINHSNLIQVDELMSCAALKFYVQLSVTNTGDMDGSHVILLFARLPKSVPGTPEKQLVGFSRIHTTSHESTETTILVDPCEHLSTADEQGIKVLPSGDHILMVDDDLEHSVSILI